MAYQFTDYSGYGNESELETRKRRAMMLAGLPEGAGLADVAGQAIGNRIDQAQNAVTQAGQLLTNPEEELKKRMGVAGPVAPEQLVPTQQVPEQLPAQGPISPEMAQQPVVQPQLPQPGPAVQVAGPAQVPVQPQQVEQAQPVQQAQPQATVSQVNQQIIDARNETDPAKRRNMFAQIMAKEDVTPGDKAIAERLFAEDYMKERKIAEAEKKIQEATPNDLSRYMREKSKEGSYVKAILYARLGLNDLAQKEQELLSPTLKMASATDSEGKQYTVERDNSGAIVRAFDSNGKTVGQEVLANLGAAALPTQSFLLPQSAGGLMQKTIIGEDGKPQVITGQVFTDPRTNTTYFQAGKKRYDTTGLSTPAQNVQNVYGAAQAGAAGKGAGEGFTPQPLKAFPGQEGGIPAGGTSNIVSNENVDQARRLDGDIQSLNNEIKRIPANDPKRNERLAILNSELQRATQQRQQLGGAIQGLPGTTGTQGVPGVGIAQQKQNLEVQTAREKEGIQVAGARSQTFNKILDEEVRPQAQAGDTVSSTRKQQFAIFDRPGVDMNKIFGLATGAGRSSGDQSWTMLRDVLLGRFEGNVDDIKQRAAALGLSPAEQSALAEYQIANVNVNAANLKKVAGAGSVSDAEQKVNREAGVDPTKVPALGAYNAMAQSQFDADKQRYKADWATTSTATNALQLDKDWRKESQKLTEIYTNIAKDRAKFIADNGSTTAAVKEGYKRYPIPEYDPNTGTWKKTKPLSSFNR